MKRAALERKRTINRWRQHNRLSHHGDASACVCDRQPNRFRKGQRVGGCGRPRCQLCHYEKIFNIPTRQLKKSNKRYREGLHEAIL